MRNPEGETATNAPNHRFWQSLGAACCCCLSLRGLALWSSPRQRHPRPVGLGRTARPRLAERDDALWRLTHKGSASRSFRDTGRACAAQAFWRAPRGAPGAWSRTVLCCMCCPPPMPPPAPSRPLPQRCSAIGTTPSASHSRPMPRAIATVRHAVPCLPQASTWPTPEDTYRFTNGYGGRTPLVDHGYQPPRAGALDTPPAPAAIELLQQQGRCVSWKMPSRPTTPGATAHPRHPGALDAHAAAMSSMSGLTPHPLPPATRVIACRAARVARLTPLAVVDAPASASCVLPDRPRWANGAMRACAPRCSTAAPLAGGAGYYASLAAPCCGLCSAACASPQKIQPSPTAAPA